MKYHISELIDAEKIQQLMERFHSMTNIPCTLIDPQGNILRVNDDKFLAAGWKTVCLEFHRKHPKSLAKCIESDTVLSRQILEKKKYSLYRCRNGLVDGAIPIFISGEHVVNLFTGQFFLEPPDIDYFRKQAADYGYDVDKYLDALSEVPVLEIGTVEQGLLFLGELAELITHMGLKEKELLSLKNELEKKVEIRTFELTNANKELKYSEERFHSLSDAAFEGIVITDQAIIVEVNQAMLYMFGYQASEIIGMAAMDFVSPEYREKVKNKILAGYEQSYESIGLKKDGSTFPIEVHARMFAYKGKQVRVTAVRDLTERKRAEEEIRTLRGILPICSICKNIRNDEGYYEQIETYIHKLTGVDFSHTICHLCMKKHYPEEYKDIYPDKDNK